VVTSVDVCWFTEQNAVIYFKKKNKMLLYKKYFSKISCPPTLFGVIHTANKLD